MSDEEAGNDFSWKSKLEEIESLPGEIFNSEAAWLKLHERIGKQWGHKRPVWYWPAAACLLLAFIIPWFFLANRNGTAVVNDNSAQKPIQSSSHLLRESNNNTHEGISSLPTEETLPLPRVEQSHKIIPLPRHTIVQSKIVQDKRDNLKFITSKMTDNAVAPVDNEIAIVIILPEKKKLKVVHINELGDPVTVSPNIAKSHEHRSLVKFINREINTSLPSSGNTGFNIFKTKAPPSN